MNTLSSTRARVALATAGAIIASHSAKAAYAYDTSSSGTIVIKNNGSEGGWEYCYYSGVATLEQTPEAGATGLTLSQIQAIKADYGAEGTARNVSDDLADWC